MGLRTIVLEIKSLLIRRLVAALSDGLDAIVAALAAAPPGS